MMLLSHGRGCGDRNVYLAASHPDPEPEATAMPQPNPVFHQICHAKGSSAI